MSRGVTGPTSALTEFLREKGITARGNISRFSRRSETGTEQNTFALSEDGQGFTSFAGADVDDASAAAAGGEAGPSNAVAGPSTTRLDRRDGKRISATQDAGDRGQADKLAALAKVKALAKARTAAAAKKRKSFKESEDDDDDEEDGYQEELSLTKAASARAVKRQAMGSGSGPNAAMIKVNPPASMVKPNGALAYCGSCRKRFSVTQYTSYIAKGPICHKCGTKVDAANTSEGSAAANNGAAKKRAASRRKLIQQQSRKVVPTLQGLCIRLISNSIEDVEDLGGMGAGSVDRISKSISKNRSLNTSTLKLFLSPAIKSLRLYDCSKLDSDSLRTIPDFCPQLEDINLQLCGQLDNEAIDAWSDKLNRSLHRLELYGPYLVRVESWLHFFAMVASNLESFKIRESPRFNLECVEAMAKYCPNITELGLAQIGPLDGKSLQHVACYDQLTYLDISDPGVSAPGMPPKSLQNEDIISLLRSVGKNLEYLDISGNQDLTDPVIVDGVKVHCSRLKALKLGKLGQLTSAGLCELFRKWGNAHGGLTMLDVQRVLLLDDVALQAIVAHSGAQLQQLNLNSDNLLTEQGLARWISADACPGLRTLDVSFVRCVNDSFVLGLMHVESVSQIWVFGCNKISDFIKSNHRVQIVGKEKDI